MCERENVVIAEFSLDTVNLLVVADEWKVSTKGRNCKYVDHAPPQTSSHVNLSTSDLVQQSNSGMTNEEQVLIENVRRGEMAAFQELVDKYKQKVYYMALDMTGNHHDAEDLSQEVFMKVYVSIKDFRGDAKLTSWLYRIAMNLCIDKSRRKRLKMVELDDKIHEKPAPGLSPDVAIQSQATQVQIQQALSKLPPRQRSIFVMRHYNELMLREIAEALGISEGTVKAQLFRAIQKLQKELGALHPGRLKSNENM